MFVGYCSKCGESIYSSDEVVRTKEGNFHYECTDEGAEQIAKRIVNLIPSEQLAYDEGASAYKSKVPLTKNPYLESDFKNSEWDKGWMAECDMDDSDSYDWSANKFRQN